MFLYSHSYRVFSIKNIDHLYDNCYRLDYQLSRTLTACQHGAKGAITAYVITTNGRGTVSNSVRDCETADTAPELAGSPLI